MADLVNLVAETLDVAIFQESAVTAVETTGAPGMFDRAPVLFRSSCYFMDIGDQAVEVAAVYAV